jgi:hypothetical protein
MGNSLYLTVPKAYARAHNLNVHDDILWLPEPDGIKLKFNEPSKSHEQTTERAHSGAKTRGVS